MKSRRATVLGHSSAYLQFHFSFPFDGKAKAKHCDTVSELIRLMCDIAPYLLIDTTSQLIDVSPARTSYGFVFNAEQLLKPDNTSESFARFLYELENFKKMGFECYSVIEYTGFILKITYFIPIGGFNMITKMVDAWINYTRKRNSYSVLAKKEFEKQFENELKQYDDATIKEVIELYG